MDINSTPINRGHISNVVVIRSNGRLQVQFDAWNEARMDGITRRLSRMRAKYEVYGIQGNNPDTYSGWHVSLSISDPAHVLEAELPLYVEQHLGLTLEEQKS